MRAALLLVLSLAACDSADEAANGPSGESGDTATGGRATSGGATSGGTTQNQGGAAGASGRASGGSSPSGGASSGGESFAGETSGGEASAGESSGGESAAGEPGVSGGTGTGGTGSAGAPAAERDCMRDADCALGQRLDVCCPGCLEAFSKSFLRASRCISGLGKVASSDCAPLACPDACPSIGCAPVAGVLCDEGTCTAVAGPGGYDCERSRAFCPPEAPVHGTDCCGADAGSECEAVCLASSFACQYDGCLGGEALSTARCSEGLWSVTSVECPSCPVECEAGGACVVTYETQGTSGACAENPCAPANVEADCASSLCEGTLGSYDPSRSAGNVVACNVASSEGP